ncbi:MAG: hypothetical protein P4L51_20270 [Puia sp.]|nr:hypothetical protein [Puia sp.]
MRRRYCCYFSSFLFFLLAVSCGGYGQQLLYGRIEKRGTAELLPGVNVANISKQHYNTSDLGGNFRVLANPGDTLVFTSVGFEPDTLIVGGSNFSENHLVLLTQNIKSLPSVKIEGTDNYQLDSIQRRQDYAALLDQKHPVTVINEKRPGDNPGFSFSPLGYFSKKEKEKRKLKKRLAKEEQDYYVDSRFSPVRVAQLTHLTGDSLQEFLNRYRPSYSFCRGASNQDMLFYINDMLSVYRTPPPVKQNPGRTPKSQP